MIQAEGDRIRVEGAMSLETATALLDTGNAMIAAGKTTVDLAAVGHVDSAGLSVLFGWMRSARAGNKALTVANAPANLLSLAEVYGVADQLPRA